MDTLSERNIAVVSEDSSLVSALKTGLIQEKIVALSLTDRPGLARAVKASHARLIVIDAAGPVSRYCDMCRRIHREVAVPIMLLLTGKDNDRIRALEAGASACIIKPVNPMELIANIRAILRWSDIRSVSRPAARKSVTVSDLVIDPDSREVKIQGKSLELTEKEFKLLLLLARNRGHTLSRRELLDIVWGEAPLESDRAVDVHICRLRKKIHPESGRAVRVVSVRGFGYRLEGR